jgi:hypothetical protein
VKIQKSRTAGRLKKYGLLRKKYPKSQTKCPRDFTPYIQAKLHKIESDIAADEIVCVDLQARLKFFTPENRRFATEELQNRQKALDMSVSAVKEFTAKYDHVHQRLANQEAFLYRSELLEFIRSKKYAMEARQIAKALAGLPYMKCRRAAERLAQLNSSVPVAFNYQIFRFVRSCWARRRARRSLTLVDWFKKEIIRLPKQTRDGGSKRDNVLRICLTEKWFFLKKAIEDVQARSGQIPGDYFIAQQLHINSLNPATPTDRIRAGREKLSE